MSEVTVGSLAGVVVRAGPSGAVTAVDQMLSIGVRSPSASFPPDRLEASGGSLVEIWKDETRRSRG